MTLSEIITSNEENMELLEGFKNVPDEIKGEIEHLYNEINDKIERSIDEYGDEDFEDEDFEDDEED